MDPIAGVWHAGHILAFFCSALHFCRSICHFICQKPDFKSRLKPSPGAWAAQMNGCGAVPKECWERTVLRLKRTPQLPPSPLLLLNSHSNKPPPLHASLFHPFPMVKPPVRWIRGAPESWSHLRSPRHDCHHALCIDHTTLCRRQFWALEYPFKEEDTAGHVGGETLFFLFLKTRIWVTPTG